jgi:hypothetical protein
MAELQKNKRKQVKQTISSNILLRLNKAVFLFWFRFRASGGTHDKKRHN